MINFAFLLGVSLPLAAFYSTNLIILLSVFLLFVHRKDLVENQNNQISYQLFYSAIPFLGIIFFWSIAKVVNEIDFKSFLAIYKYGINSKAGLKDILFLLKENILFSTGIFWILLRWLILFFIIILFTNNKKVRESHKLGMYLGTSISCVVILFQILNIVPIDIFSNYSSFWHWQKRYYGTFSDPNSFGIFVFLFLPIIFFDIKKLTNENQKSKQISLTVFFLIVFILGWFSGSRSYLLGLLLITLLYLIKNIKICYSKLLNLKGIFATIIFISLCLLLVYNTSSGARILESLSLQNIEKALFSRVIFWKICIWNWLSNPILGIGVDNFKNSVTPNLISRGIDLNLWSDNANNFYLGILSELGIVGAISIIPLFHFLYKFLSNSANNNCKDFYNYSTTLIAFSVLLFLGPHLDFNEILIISAFIIGNLLSNNKNTFKSFEYIPFNKFNLSKKVKLSIFVLSPLILVGILSKASTKLESGVYAWEKDEEGIYRWTRNKAVIRIDCENYNLTRIDDFASKTINLKLQSPRIQNIVLKTPYEDEKNIQITGNTLREIPITCIGNQMPIRIKTEKVFIPALDKQSLKKQVETRDNRVLGIKVYSYVNDKGNTKH